MFSTQPFYFTHPYLREQALHFCRKAKKLHSCAATLHAALLHFTRAQPAAPVPPMRTAVLLLEIWGLSAKPDVLRSAPFYFIPQGNGYFVM